MKVPQAPIDSQDVAGLTSLMFQGGSFVCWTLGAWSLTAALHITQSFAVEGGLFSNWIAWIALGFGLRLAGKFLSKELATYQWQMPQLARARRSRTTPSDDRSAAAA